MVSQEQLINGIVDYIEKEVIEVIPERKLQIFIGTYAKTMQFSPTLFERFVLSKPMLRAILIANENGEYDIECILRALRDTMTKYGDLEFTIPVIPIVNPTEKLLKFKATDVDKLRKYIEG